jgi:hypothetical protein
MRPPDIIDNVGGSVLTELLERSGFCDAWDATDEAIQHEIRREIGRRALEGLLKAYRARGIAAKLDDWLEAELTKPEPAADPEWKDPYD